MAAPPDVYSAVAIKCRRRSPPASVSGARFFPGVFGDFGGFADDAELTDGYLALSDRPGIGFEGQVWLLSHHARA